MVSLLVAVPSGFADSLKATYSIVDGGQPRTFVVAGDEIHERRQMKRLPLAGSADQARGTAQRTPGADLILYEKGIARTAVTRRFLTKRIAVQLAPGADPTRIADAARVLLAETAPGGAVGWFVMEASAEPGSALEAAERLRKVPGVRSAQPLLARQHSPYAFTPNDPFFPEQFHLFNTGQHGATVGIDVNIASVWETYNGTGITIGIVDDGLERTHPDLAPNYSAALSYDFNGRDDDPLPPPFDFDDHGTACAGIAAARGNNGIGVCGAAFEATLAGLRLIAAPTTDEDDAAAFAFRNDAIHIKSNSWGTEDDGRTLEGPGPFARAAIQEGVRTGRGGRGTIFLFSSGNGGPRDGADFDGFVSMRETIGVSALAPDGVAAEYAEPGAAILCVAPSSSGPLGTTTTDRLRNDGYNFNESGGDLPDLDYTNSFGGTSSAAPLVAGCVALMLEANPDLGWRDVQEILLRTARKVDAASIGWQTNGVGWHFHHFYGAGLVDAEAAVRLAQTWTNLGPNIVLSEAVSNLAAPIPDGKSAGITQVFNFNDPRLRVEHAVVTVSILHAARGQFEITLESPAGTISHLADLRPRDRGDHFLGWGFLTRQMWGEAAQGVWKVRVSDRVRGTVGIVQDLKLELFGASPEGHPVANGIAVVSDANGNGAVDPSEMVTVSLALKNEGGATDDNVVATLLGNSKVAVSSGPQNYGTLAPGMSVSRDFTFTALGEIGETMFLTLQLNDSSSSAGTVAFPVTIGRTATATFTSEVAFELPDYRSRSGTGSARPYPGTIEVSGLPPSARITMLSCTSITSRTITARTSTSCSPARRRHRSHRDVGHRARARSMMFH
jgi:subtilisin-like proprotein convertase family protein/subtilisin family serine protease